MAEVKTIKGVDEETWAEFKSLAAKNQLHAGSFFEKMVRHYEQSTQSFWDRVLDEEVILSEEEGKAIEKVVHHIRKERGFRA